jgi:hypothetical protein
MGAIPNRDPPIASGFCFESNRRAGGGATYRNLDWSRLVAIRRGAPIGIARSTLRVFQEPAAGRLLRRSQNPLAAGSEGGILRPAPMTDLGLISGQPHGVA